MRTSMVDQLTMNETASMTAASAKRIDKDRTAPRLTSAARTILQFGNESVVSLSTALPEVQIVPEAQSGTELLALACG